MGKVVNEIKRYPMGNDTKLMQLAMRWCNLTGQYEAAMRFIEFSNVSDEEKLKLHKDMHNEYKSGKIYLADILRKVLKTDNAISISMKHCAFIEFDVKAEENNRTSNKVMYNKEGDIFVVELGDDIKEIYEEFREKLAKENAIKENVIDETQV